MRYFPSPNDDFPVYQRNAFHAPFDLSFHVELVGVIVAALVADHYWIARSVLVRYSVLYLLREAATFGFPQLNGPMVPIV